MSEITTDNFGEITPDQQSALVTRIRELVPALSPNFVPTEGIIDEIARLHPEMDRETIEHGLDERGVVKGRGFITMEANAEYTLNEDSIRLEYCESGEDSWEASVSVHRNLVKTEEGVSVDTHQSYRLSHTENTFRFSTWLFKRAQPVRLEELQKIFTPEYLEPIIDIYESSARSSKQVFSPARFNDAMSILAGLGPDKLQPNDVT